MAEDVCLLNREGFPLVNLFLVDVVFAKEEWAKLRRSGALEFAKRRLTGLSNSLGDKPYLDGNRFTVDDLMMATVLRIPAYTGIVTSDARLGAYLERCTSRPAFKRALDAQMGDFRVAA
jgi:glutathione S-transferase